MTYFKVARIVANRIRALFQQAQLKNGIPPLEIKPLYIKEDGADASLSTEEGATDLLRKAVESVTKEPVTEAESPFVTPEHQEGGGRLSRWARR